MALPPHLSDMTIERYAALCAECNVNPQWFDQIGTRYNVRTRQERDALDEHFRARMNEDANLRESWRSAYERYEEWAKSQRGR